MSTSAIRNPGEATLREILERRAAAEPGHVYCRFEGRDYTIGWLHEQSNRIANGLLARGLKKGDRVALMLPSHPEHQASLVALMKLGLVRVSVNPHLKGAALDHLFDSSQPRALLADTAYEPIVAGQLAAGKVAVVVWRSGDADAPAEYERFAALPATLDAPGPVADDILALTPSSGTTGHPKGVMKSDRTLRGGAMSLLHLNGGGPGDVFLLWESLHHGAGVAVSIAAVLERITLAMVDRFSASRFWQQCREFGVTHVHYLGSIVPMLLKQPPGADDRGHGVRVAWGGGCPPAAWRAFAERFGVAMREGYGLSELTTFVTVNLEAREGSIGRPLSWFEVRVIDAEGRDLPAGEAGELIVRATVPGMQFLGYFRNEEAVRAAWRGDWFCTGDLVKQDADGFLYYAGRLKDSVRRRGINISAWEVEHIVNQHPEVAESALVGVPSELGEDELKIFLRSTHGRPVDEAAFVRWCAERMPYFQVPRYVVQQVGEFPKTPTQRVQKKELSRSTGDCWDRERAGIVLGKH
jgi:crotonobetaine/carnitine-CoA ligase